MSLLLPNERVLAVFLTLCVPNRNHRFPPSPFLVVVVVDLMALAKIVCFRVIHPIIVVVVLAPPTFLLLFVFLWQHYSFVLSFPILVMIHLETEVVYLDY